MASLNESIRTYSNGVLHSLNGEPAEISLNGTKKWYQYGQLHRDNDLPAVIYLTWAKILVPE